MESLRRLVPSAGGLIVFEAAGRLSSFTRAAEELAMSQAAVSYAVKALEEQLGLKLFKRVHRAVELTEAGARFHADVTLGLSHIRRSAEELRTRSRDPHVTLSASMAFGSMWMLPRLPRLRDELPDIDLRIQTGDRDVEIDSAGIPLAVRCGVPSDWPLYDAALLAPERIYAVASPAYVAQHGLPRSVEEIARHRLVHLEEPFRPVPSWNEWLQRSGITVEPAHRGLLINDYTLVIQAVLEGQGIALGWQHLTDRMVRSGLLIKLPAYTMQTSQGFYVVWPKHRPLSPAAKRIRDWLVELGKRERAEAGGA